MQLVESIFECIIYFLIYFYQVYPTLLPVKAATEELPLKYNLMEEMYGRKWAKTPDKDLSSIDCTVGKASLFRC